MPLFPASNYTWHVAQRAALPVLVGNRTRLSTYRSSHMPVIQSALHQPLDQIES